MKHKHFTMINRWATDTSSAVFLRRAGDSAWRESQTFPTWRDDFDYFVCDADYANVALHWLNGGEVETTNTLDGDWESIPSYEIEPDFYFDPASFIGIKITVKGGEQQAKKEERERYAREVLGQNNEGDPIGGDCCEQASPAEAPMSCKGER